MIPGRVPEMLRSPLDAAASGEAALPSWDLSDLYKGQEDPALNADLDRADAEARAFQAKYATKLADLSGDELAAAIEACERIEEVLGRAMSFASLIFAGDS
jgi:oligoendopeptidase F